MATITLPGFTFGSVMGIGAFEGIDSALTNVKKSTKTLTETLGKLKSKIDFASVATNVESSQEQAKKAEEREYVKKGSLSLVYERLNALISDVGSVDSKASGKIRERKEAFYDRYNYLKPECEKSRREKVKDALKKGWDGLCDIGSAIKNFAMDVVEWVKEHWKELLIGLAFIVVGALITVLTGGAAAGFWAAFGAALVKGLAAAALSAAIGGTINAGCTYYQYRKAGFSHATAMKNAKNAFGDGAANGFMTGGISFGVGSAINAGATAILGKSINFAGKSFWRSVGKGALFGATTNSITSTITSAIKYWANNGTLKGAGGTIFKDAICGAISGGIFGGITGGVSWNKTMAQNNSYVENYRKTTMESLRTQMKNNISGTNVKNNSIYNASENIKDITAFNDFLKNTPGYSHSVQRVDFYTGNEATDNIVTGIFDGILDAM